MTSGEKIKELRLKKGLTQLQFAELVGYHTASAINKIELGKRQLKFSQIVAFARVLGCDPHEIVSDIDVPELNADNKYNLLDSEDRANVDRYIMFLLEQEKYKGGATSE